jgi:acetyl esterase/lipase
LGCVCVSVEYRLAPEVPYPGPLDDCEEGLRFIVEHAHELQIDAQRVGVGGRSAG